MQRSTPPPDPMDIVRGLRKEEANRMRELSSMLRDGTARIETEGDKPPWLDGLTPTVALQLDRAAQLLDPK